MTARRLYGKGSCSICQQRKTRCELPTESLELPPGLTPLPPESACHRCRTLSLPCVILPQRPPSEKFSRISSRKDPSAESNITSCLTVLPEPSTSEGSSARNLTRSDPIIKLGLSSSHEISASTPAHSPPTIIPPHSTYLPPNDNQYRWKYYGRPLELTSALSRRSFPPTLGMASSTTQTQATGSLEVILERLKANYSQMNETYDQLRSLAPFLPDLPTLIDLQSQSPSSALTLLLSSSLYLCSSHDNLSLQDLAMVINTAKTNLMIQSPDSLHAIQALLLLSIIAPFGILPNQSVVPSELVVARGYLKAAKSTAEAISLEMTVKSLIASSANAWDSVETWTWLSLCALEAEMALEGSIITPPHELVNAQPIAETLIEIAHQKLDGDDLGLGKAILCERLLRLGLVYADMEQPEKIAESYKELGAARALLVIGEKLEDRLLKLEMLAERMDRITEQCNMVAPDRPCLLIRDTTRLTDSTLIRRIAIRSLIRTAMMAYYDPISTGSYQSGDRMSAASDRAADPVDPVSVAKIFQHEATSGAADLLKSWSSQLATCLEDLVIVIMSSNQHSRPFLLPVHRLAAITIEACSILVELQSAVFVATRSVRWFRQYGRIRPRSGILRQTAAVLRAMEQGKAEAGMSICDIAGQLICSMVDGAEEAAKGYEKQERAAQEMSVAKGGEGAPINQGESLLGPELTEMDIWLYQLSNGLLPGVEGWGAHM